MPKFSDESHTGERGIDFIAAQCRAVGYIWRPTGNADVGLDGEIEIRVGEYATGQIIKVQSKAGKSYLRNEKSDRFDFYTDLNHLEYWQGATNPVILVVYDPEADIGYWVDVKEYIRAHPEVIKKRPHKITFDKTSDRFTSESARDLLGLFEPDYRKLKEAYRQHVIDRFSKLTLYSVTSDAPLAVDLERVFVKLSAIQRKRPSLSDFRLRTKGVEYAFDMNDPLEESIIRTDDLSAYSRHFEETSVTLSISEALRQHKRLTVIGAPGAGKTTLLKFLAITYARNRAKEQLGLEEERVPFFIALRDFNRFLDGLAKQGELMDLSYELLPRFLNKHIRDIAPHLNLPDDFFSRLLDANDCIVLLDGLDEVADIMKRGRAAEAVAAFARHYAGSRFIVTSRPRGYEGEAKQRLSTLCEDCAIRDFDDEDMTEFARSWYEAVTRDRLGDTDQAIAEARSRADHLLGTIKADSRVRALAHNPLLLSVLAMVHQRNVELPQRRAELYDECTDMLLGYWDQTKGGDAARELAAYGELTRSEKRSLLEPVALWFHERGATGLEADKAELEKEIARQFEDLFGDGKQDARRRASLFLSVIDERAGLLVERESCVYAFAHLTFQEYLAARAIADREDYIEYTLRHLHDPWWREAILLEVGHLSDVRHFGRRARRLTTALIREIRNAGSLLESVLKRDFLLSARALADVGPLGVDDDLRQEISDELFSLWRETPYEPQQNECAALFAYSLPTKDGARIHEEIMKCLTGEDRELRLRMLQTLGQMGKAAATEPVISSLFSLLSGSDFDARRRAASALGQIGTERAVDGLLEALKDEGRYVRGSAAYALGQIYKEAMDSDIAMKLMEFWKGQLAHTKYGVFGCRAARTGDIAYEELQRITGRLVAGAGDEPSQ